MNNRKIKTTLITLGVAIIAGLSWLRAEDAVPAATPADQSAKSKFHGHVTAIDANAMTFTVNDQTFTVTGQSRITRNGKTATLADVHVGEPARGSYTKGADGKLDVNKVRFGKKMGTKTGSKKKASEDTDTTATNAPPAAPDSQ